MVTHEIKFIRINGIFRVIFICSVLIFLNACQTDPVMFSLTTTDVAKGIGIVENLTDQSILTKIALNAKNSDIRMAAFNKLTDQSMLAKVVENEEADNFSLQDIALSKLTDQSLLEKIALENRFTAVRSKAIRKISDYNSLVKIALEDNLDEARITALEMLTNLNLISKLAAEKNNEKIQLLYKFISAFNSVPVQNRFHLMKSIVREIDYLSSPDLYSELGEIVSINTFWAATKANYTNNISLGGEKFECLIIFKKLHTPIKNSWHTDFPFQVSSGTIQLFYTANIKEGDLLELALDRLSQDILAKIANNNKYDFVCEACVHKINDQSLLTKIALETPNVYVRGDAVRKLTDQSLLAKIAVNDTDYAVRMYAVEKLTDQLLLAKFATNDENANIRDVAVKNLTDENLLSKIAVTDSIEGVRRSAVEKLTNKALLKKIVLEDKNSIVREAAQSRIDLLQ
jgi:hypothetical protein